MLLVNSDAVCLAVALDLEAKERLEIAKIYDFEVFPKVCLECIEGPARAEGGHIIHMYQDDGDFVAMLVVQAGIGCRAGEAEGFGKCGVELVVPGFAGLFEAVERLDEVPNALDPLSYPGGWRM